jgi:predicted TIM-barrel enzyme
MVTYAYDVPGRGAVNVVGPQPQVSDDQSAAAINALAADQKTQEGKIEALAAKQTSDERKFGSAISTLADNQAKQGKGFQDEIDSITKTLRHTADVLGVTTGKLKETTDDVKELDRADESEAKGLKTAQRNALIGVSVALGATLVSLASLGLHLRKSKKANAEAGQPAG